MRKWYEQPLKDGGIVISSRIRLARNLSAYPFYPRISEEQADRLSKEVKSALEKINLGDNKFDFIDVAKLGRYEGLSMVENHIISPDFLKNHSGRLLALTQDRSISIMVNEEDHIRIQVLASGLRLQEALDTANKIDDAMDESLDYAFDDQLGFLTACPSNLGTGLRASVMVHIPALEKAGALTRLSGTLSKLGLTIRGTYGEGSKALGAVYQVSNQITLGISEEQAVKNLTEIVMQIVEKEKEARKTLLASEKFIDQIYRSYGILKYAKMISSEEFFDLVSYLKIGLDEQVFSQDIKAHIRSGEINSLIFQVGGASICEQAGRELSPEERDTLRAKMIQEYIGK